MAKKNWQLEYLDNDGFLFFGPRIFSKYNFRDKEANTKYKVRYTLNKTARMFEYDGLPDTITVRDLELLTQTAACSIWFRATNYDGKVYAVYGTRGGELNQNFMPTKAIVANPVLGSYELEIDKDCVVMPNDTTYTGLLPMLGRYCTALTENELSMHLLSINTRAQKILSAGDNSTIESARQYLKDIEEGKQGVIVNPKWGAQDKAGLKVDDFSGGSSTTKLLDCIEYEQYLSGSMMNELGIRAPFNMKREALGDSEVSQMDMAILPMVDDMLYNRQVAIDKINAMFGLNITVKLSSAWEDIHREVSHMEEVDKEEEYIDEEDAEVLNEETEDNKDDEVEAEEVDEEEEGVKDD